MMKATHATNNQYLDSTIEYLSKIEAEVEVRGMLLASSKL